ncbi:MAG: nucleotidyltransferase family protein [Micromonosporaceae bacterium]
MSVAGLLLAAGAGRRYGMPKALVDHGGRLWVDRAAQTLRDGGCAPVVVVLGAQAAQVRLAAELSGVTVVVNQQWATGMGSSLRAGLAALEPTAADAAVVMLVDTPDVTAAAVARLAASAGPAGLAVATYHGERGHPVLLGREHWAGVAESAIGDVGARPYLAGHPTQEVPCEDIADGADLDLPPRG